MITTTLGNSEYIIHHTNQVEVYGVTREQLELISRGAESDWKSRWQNSFSILLTCLINIIALGWDMRSSSFRLNIGIGVISLLLGVMSLIFYVLDEKRQRSRLKDILKQPIQNVSLRGEKLRSEE